MNARFESLSGMLRSQAEERPDAKAFDFVQDGSSSSDVGTLTYAALDHRARRIGAWLEAEGAAGKRVLLLYTPGLDFVAALYGCLYAGAIAVPAYPPEPSRKARSLARLKSILAAAEPALVLTTSAVLTASSWLFVESPELRSLRRLASDTLFVGGELEPASWPARTTEPDAPALLQFTSGSTSSAKGVMLSHRNVLANLTMMWDAYRPILEGNGTPETRHTTVMWVPFHHDMGLIGGILMGPFLGSHTVLMSPISFLRRPIRWLRLLQAYKASYTACPNFALDLCARHASPRDEAELADLDLSALKLLIVGAEPVRPNTLRSFAQAFGARGFDSRALQPSYGLAEAALAVSTGRFGDSARIRSFDDAALASNHAVPSDSPRARQLVSAGAPLTKQRVVIVAPETGKECPPAKVGEIWVAGPNVADGYWNLPETQETFGGRLDGSSPSERFLRTGDLGFIWEGELYVTGRLKDLVIVRGQNIYPQDIEETVEPCHPQLRQGGVAAFAIEQEDGEGLGLIAEVDLRGVSSDPESRRATFDEILRTVREVVAREHGVAVARIGLIRAHALLRTSSGKVQRRATYAAFSNGELPVLAQWEAPSAGAIEAYLSTRIAALLQLGENGLDRAQRLTELGLDSLSAVELQHRLERDFGVQVPVGAWLEGRTLGELAARIAKSAGDGVERSRPPAQTRIGEVQSLSYGQSAMWHLHRAAPESAAYHVAFAARLGPGLNVEALERTFRILIDRHPELRATYPLSGERPVRLLGGDPGEPIFSMAETSADAAFDRSRAIADEIHRPFDLAKGPVLRIRLFRLVSGDFVLTAVAHHIAADLWSLEVLLEELGAIYTALHTHQESILPPAPPMADHAQWQRDLVASEEGESSLAYWREELSGPVPWLDLPLDRPRPLMPSDAGDAHHFVLGPELTRRLEELARTSGVTMYSLLLTAFEVLLHRLSGQNDILVGSPAAGRRHASLAKAVGSFINPIVVRGRFSDNPTFGDALERIHSKVREAAEHQDYPFSLLVEKLAPPRHPSRSPFFDVTFQLERPRHEKLAAFIVGRAGQVLELGALAMESIERTESSAQLDLALTLVDAGEELLGSLRYRTDLFDAAGIRNMTERFRVLLEAVLEAPHRRVSELRILPEQERHRLLWVWNRTRMVFPREQCVHELFEKQAEKTPHAIAVVFEGAELSYAELNRRANRLAHRLRSYGVGPDVRVAICPERSIDMLVGLLAILKAGGAYVPIDPSYPKDRIAYMLEDAAPALLLTMASLAPVLPEYRGRVLWLDTESVAAESSDNLRSAGGAESLAYVMYTSGSTGKPKGVAIEHHSLVSFLMHMARSPGLNAQDRVLALTSLSFDIAGLELWLPLSVGACVEIASRETSADGWLLGQRLDEGRTTLLQATPSTFRMLFDAGWRGSPTLKILVGGEALSDDLARKLLEGGGDVWNMYGPTETTIWSTAHRLSRDEPVLIGRPIGNTYLYIVDEHLELVPIGTAGELLIGGEGVARGYWGKTDPTRERFIDDPFSTSVGARLYRTGDRCRYRRDGSIEFLGRLDEQVKIRGHRIELGEIESALGGHPNVRDAVVVVNEAKDGEKRLIGYFIPNGDISASALRQHLAAALPAFMIPKAWIELASFPSTPNGKIDRKALASRRLEVSTENDYAAPEGPTEELLTGIYAEVVGIEKAGAHDDFFELGGHSLLAMQVMARVRGALGVELPVRALFEARTVRALAKRVEASRDAVPSPAEEAPRRASRAGSLPLSFAQQRMWFLEQLNPNTAMYNIPSAVRIRGGLRLDALQHALDEVVMRHEALRTRFVGGASHTRQEIVDRLSVTIDVTELRADEGEAAIAARIVEEAQRPFALEDVPLVRATILRLSQEESILLLTIHHIVSDGWSMAILVRELGALYEAFRQGKPSPLADRPLQYVDYAVWQRAWLTGDRLAHPLAYWKERLEGAAPFLELPLDRPRPARQSFRGAAVPVALSKELTKDLLRVGRQENATLFMLLLAAYQALLFRHTGQRDIVVGAPIANRTRSEWEGVIGLFINSLALRTEVDGDLRFRDLLRRVREVTLGAYAHQDVPFEKLVEELSPPRDPSRSPIYQVMLALQNVPMGKLSLGDVELSILETQNTIAKFDLNMNLTETEDGLLGALVYDTALFDRSTIEAMVEHYLNLLRGVVKDPEQRIRELPLLGAVERQQLLVGWNDTKIEVPAELFVHERIEEHATKRPDAVALVFEGEELTYRELDRRANALAARLRARGAGPDVHVGICVQRSFDMVVGLLGILKSGAAYVSLEPSQPSERLRWMIDDARPMVILTQRALEEKIGTAVGGAYEHWILDDLGAWVDDGTRLPRPHLHGSSTAYVLYTSGSTGKPKGVMNTHEGLLHRLLWTQDLYPVAETDVLLLKTPYSFDISLWECFSALMAGCKLVIARPEGHKDLGYLTGVIEREGVTVVHFVPSMLSVFLAEMGPHRCRSLKRVFSAGEALPYPLTRRFYEKLDAELLNLYGPTEAALTLWPCPREEGEAIVPIGAPSYNSQFYVLDPWLTPAPVGVSGELYVAGSLLARGYVGRADLTADRFIPDPFSQEPGGRMYKTGDICRWRRDGNLEYLGRNDEQVKVRGHRIELGEVESALRAQPRVRDAAAVVRTDSPGDKRLVGYLVLQPSPEPQTADCRDQERILAHIRSALGETLPEYMVPSILVVLEELPRTSSGKIDRRALPVPAAPQSAGANEQPLTPVEKIVGGIWCELLELDSVGSEDDFFELGGHSLLATQVLSRLQTIFHVDFPLVTLIQLPTLSALCERIEASRRPEAAASEVPLVPAARTGALPLSFAQQRLWFLGQFDSDGSLYNIAGKVRLRGRLDVEALERSLAEIVRRHEVLRTRFVARAGEALQEISDEGAITVTTVDLGEHGEREADEREAEISRLTLAEARRPFDLAAGVLLRATLLRCTDTDHVLLFTMHHIVSDGWSLGVLVREFGELYEAFSSGKPSPLLPLPIQYADYAAWQRRRLSGEVLETQISYWRDRLAGAPPVLELPTDRPRPAAQSYRGASYPVALPLELSGALLSLGRCNDATLFMTLLAAFQTLLWRYTGQTDIVVGSPIANRTHTDVEGLIGFFVNMLPLRVRISAESTFEDLLAQVRAVAMGAFSHQDVPFEKLVEELAPTRDLSRSPLFQVEFALQNAPMSALTLPGLRVDVIPTERTTAKFDLSLFLGETARGIEGTIDYNTDLFDASTIARLAAHYENLLRAIVAGPARRLSELPLLTAAERDRLLVTWGDAPADLPPAKCIHELFEEQVERTNDAVAVRFGDDRRTYRELNQQANRLAHHLRARGVGPDVRVGLCVERSIEMVVGLLGILKAGGAYVPLDPSYPRERLAFMLEDSGAALLVVDGRGMAELGPSKVPIVRIEDRENAADANIVSGVNPHHLAYVLYTSGSTGKPKGALGTHRGSVNRFDWMWKTYPFRPGEVCAQKTNLGFGDAIWEIFGPLLQGVPIVIIPDAIVKDPSLFVETLSEERISRLVLVPSLLRVLLNLETDLARKLAPLWCWTTSGETLPLDLCEKFFSIFPDRVLLNLYGCSEAAADSTYFAPTAGMPWSSVPIGRPISNVRVRVLDSRRELVPVGVAGELYIGGMGVARGYHNRPELTAEKFIRDPFVEDPDARLFRTGDLCRWLPDGALEYLGRKDAQVKIRGYRIELGEIESVLLDHPMIRQAAVVVSDGGLGEKRLVACVVADPNADMPALGEHVKNHLPGYMVPSSFVKLDALPLTPNGKVDRAALLALALDHANTAKGAVSGRNPVEDVLIGIFSTVLDSKHVGIYDDFFADLGGHSLLATQVMARVRKALGVELRLAVLFETPTVAGLAERIGQARQTSAPLPAEWPLVRALSEGAPPLSFAQQRLWFLHQLDPDSTAYNMPFALRLRGRLDVEATERAIAHVVARHEALRTRFVADEDGPRQEIDGEREMVVGLVSLEHLDGEAQETDIRQRTLEEARRPFSLASGPLLRATLLRCAADDHVLLFTMHHIISDGWSMGVLVRELAATYEALIQGKPSPLAPLPIQYRDYAAWQRRWLSGPVTDPQMAYWKKQLAGACPALELPTYRVRPPVSSHRGASHAVSLPAELSSDLAALSRRENATLFMTLLASFQVLLWRYTGETDIIVGSPIANRPRAELEELIGFFVNTLALRTTIAPNWTFRQMLERVRDVALEAYANQDVPFEKVVEELSPQRDLGRSPIFQVMLGLQNAPVAPLALPGVTLSPMPIDDTTAKFDVSLLLRETDGRIDGTLEYSTDLFDAAWIAQLAGHYETLLRSIVADPNRRIADLPLLTAAEHAQLLAGWTEATTKPSSELLERLVPQERLVHEQIEDQAAKTPDRVAVTFEGNELTYWDLQQRVGELAARLRREGVRAETRVGVCVERSLDSVVALLAILKAGGAYVALEPQHPRERLVAILEDARPSLVLAQRVWQEKLADFAGPGCKLVMLDERDTQKPDTSDWVAPRLEGASAAYILYTSGSTGKPKGVVNTHEGLLHRLSLTQREFPLQASDVVLQRTAYSFDVSLWEIFWPLTVGAKVVLAPRDCDADIGSLADIIEREKVTFTHFVPSLLEVVLDEWKPGGGASLRQVFSTGEALPSALARRFHEKVGAELVNMYGPTEAAITLWHCPKHEERRAISIAGPHAEVCVLDERLVPVPVGVAGELYLRGPQLARGYLGQGGLTAERFIPNPFACEAGERMYKTGDVCRWRLDGTLEYLGRNDEQVKIRGNRIELKEIEAALRAHPAVRDAVVMAREDSPRDKRLVAYLVSAANQTSPPPRDELRRALQSKLPSYMIPSSFVWLATIPVTSNGKVDRRKLPAPELDSNAAGFVAPRTHEEKVIAAVFEKLLRVERVGAHDDFFDLGGHSLLATQLAIRLSRELQVRLPLRTIFEARTVSALAVLGKLLAARGSLAASPHAAAPGLEEGEI